MKDYDFSLNLKIKFIERTKKHISLVNRYAEMLGQYFPNHDKDKLNYLLEGYKFYIKTKDELTEKEKSILDRATYIHVISNKHHPEYWSKTSLEGFTRENAQPNGPLDVPDMPEIALIEMVCDWKATGDEKENTITWWYDKVNGNRWLFTSEQQKIIEKLINKLEG